MTPSGEAWLGLVETPLVGAKTIGFFHRSPGGRFEYDKSATETVEPLLEQLERPTAPRPGLRRARVRHADGEHIGIRAPEGRRVDARNSAAATPRHPRQRTDDPPSRRCRGPGRSLGRVLARQVLKGTGSSWATSTTANGTSPRAGSASMRSTSAAPWPLKSNYVEPDGAESRTGRRRRLDRSKVYLDSHNSGHVVARYDGNSGKVTNSWCTLPVANSCEEPLGSAAVPDAFFATEGGPVALCAARTKPSTSTPAVAGRASWRPATDRKVGAAFTGPDEGWLGGTKALGQWSPQQSASLLTPWPLPDRSPLTSVALAPGSQAAGGRIGRAGGRPGRRDAALRRVDRLAGRARHPTRPPPQPARRRLQRALQRLRRRPVRSHPALGRHVLV